MFKFAAILLLATVLLFSVVAKAEEADTLGADKHDHPHDVGVGDCPCLVTYEYRPVCGSNGVTYSNRGSLECAKKCLKRSDLQVMSEGHC